MLYKVTFTWDDSYTPKVEGVRNVSLVVEAADKFAALTNGWKLAAIIQKTEPKSMEATRVGE